MFEGQIRRITLAFVSLLLMSVPLVAQDAPVFTPGNLVVVVEGCGIHSGTCTSVANGTGTGTGHSSAGGYGDNQAAPLTLFQYAPTGTSSVSFVNSLVLPQTAFGANLPVSSEYGSSSEGTLQLSAAGQYLTFMGYGINAATFDAAYAPLTAADPYGALPSGALAQSGSLTGHAYTPVARVLALVDAYGNVNSSTALFNIFNNNNPRSAYTADGKNFYVSGQGNADLTGGVFYTIFGSSSATAITGADTTDGTTPYNQDTRTVGIYNNTLYVTFDSKEGTGFNRSGIGTLGSNPTSLYNVSPPSPPVTSGPTALTGFQKTGKVTIVTGASSNGNNLNNTTTKVNGVAQNLINLSPSNFFFAQPNILYIADTGNPKNDSNGDNAIPGQTNIGDGGLQKWVNTASDGSGTWNLKYTLYQGLNLVNNTNSSGTSGLYGLTGVVNGTGAGATVSLYVTNSTLSDLDTTYLYGITDTLLNNTPPGAALAFSLLDTAPSDSNFKGVSFAPTLPAGSATITSSPSGVAFTSANSGCAAGGYTTPVTLVWAPGSSCSLSVVTPQSGGPGIQYVFSQWQDGTTGATDTFIAPATAATYTAAFITQYQLSTAAGTGGSVSAGGFFTSGTSAMVTATPALGYYFVNFTGTTTSTANPLSVEMNQPQSITANFAPMATHFAVSAASPETAGIPFTLTVTALDQFNNPATGYSGAAHFTSSDGGAALPANYTFVASDNGFHVFPATLTTAGAQTISATDTATSSITGTSGSIAVIATTAASFAVSAASPETAGTPFSLMVTALDPYNNRATGYAGTAHFTSSDAGAGVTLPADYTFVGGDSGAHIFPSTLATAGTQIITATDTVTSSITGTSNTIAVIAATATHFTVSAPGTATPGTPFNLTVTAVDAYSNTATGYSGTAHFTSNDAGAGVTLPANYSFVPGDSGSHTFPNGATLTTEGLRTITATDSVTSAITGTSNAIALCPCTIWSNSTVPTKVDNGPDSAVELGVKFTSSIDGTITGLRFYKSSNNTGTHVGNLWSSTGILLATATFTSETASGWQQVTFSPPVAITANTVYVASYHTNVGHFSGDQTFFATAGVNNPPLQALSNAVGGGNGVYRYGASAFPNSSFNSTNYWVDVVFGGGTAPPPPSCTSIAPCTIWSNSTVPTKVDNGPDSAVELGVKFTSSIDGTITGLRFYKSSNNTGTHVGNLWSSTGTLLATATFTGETASGWQQVTFSPPVAITANTVYVASYHTNVGHFSGDQAFFATAGVNNPPLQALGGGLNGLYKYGASAFPNSSFNSTNYWVDVLFAEGAAPPPPSCTNIAPCTMWSNSTVPTKADNGPDSAVELGVKFTSSIDGTITGLRFYKSGNNTGTHVGNLWSSTGILLATATFTSETASGWQQVTFSTPVTITANTVYVASYHTNVGHFSADQNFFTPAGVNSPPLQALANGSSGGDGVFLYGPGGIFPSNTYNSTNYWVDVVFQAP